MSNNSNIYDLLIIGGGVNGCGIARDASGRGLSVYLCEQYDLANETSSRSTKLIHGGLRYLEQYEFRLVREALAEREVLLNIAPHIIQPQQFIIPHNKLLRPRWLVWLGLLLYDRLGWRWRQRSRIPKSKRVKLTTTNLFGKPLKNGFKSGFSYYDCKVDDARLVILNALSAKSLGAVIKTHTKLITARREQGMWCSTLQNLHTQEIFTVYSKALINAAGPWVDKVISNALNLSTASHLDLVKGSHIVVPIFYDGEQAYFLQNDDQRIGFVIPFHGQFTLVGTTDVLYKGDPAQVKISADERAYLCNLVNRYFKQTLTPADIVYEWSGVRPLQSEATNNPTAITRDYKLEITAEQGQAPLLSIFGGKITTYRKLAEHALEKLQPYFSEMGANWTSTLALPGGNMPLASLPEFIHKLLNQYRYLCIGLLVRYAHSYGTLTHQILANVNSMADLGIDFGATLYAKEVDYLIAHEWAQSVEDILWRRTKLGLYKTQLDIARLTDYVASARMAF